MFGKSKAKLLEDQISIIQEELYQTKKQLNETKTLFYSYLKQQNMNGYILHVSSNGVILNASGGVYHVLGYTIDQLIGKRLSEITNSEDKKKVQDCLCRELRFQGNIRRTSVSNGTKTIQSFAYVMKDDASIVFTEWDVSETIGDTKTNLSYVINALPIMAYIKDSDGIFCLVNNKFAEACGKEVDYFENRSKINGLLFQTLYTNDKHIHTSNESISFELEWPDGISRRVICECQPISSINKGNFYSYKQPLYLHTIRAETDTISPNTQQQDTYGAHFRCTYINNVFKITYTTNNFIEIIKNQDFVKSIHKEDIDMFYYSLNKVSQSAHPWRWQGRVMVNKQLKRINIIAWPINQNDSSEMLGMIQDLTNETYEKKINMLLMRHITDAVALHSFQDGIKPEMKVYSHSIHALLGYESIENDMFWQLHPDDTPALQDILYKMKRGIADTSVYRIKHRDNYWVKVKTEFIPFDNEFITITTKV